MSPKSRSPYRLAGVTLDAATVMRRSPEIEQERNVAIYDLLEKNHFQPAGSDGGPYLLDLGIAEGRLVFDVKRDGAAEHRRVALSLTPFRRVLKDYLAICDSYYVAIREAHPVKTEAIDMGRRGLHDEGSNLLMERLSGKIEIDFETARRLFTLICALSLKL